MATGEKFEAARDAQWITILKHTLIRQAAYDYLKTGNRTKATAELRQVCDGLEIAELLEQLDKERETRQR